MKYWMDTKFLEDGQTIDLLSIGIVAEDGRTYYGQNFEAKFEKAADWVWRNVFPHLGHFHMRGARSCNRQQMSGCGDKLTGACHDADCPWRYRHEIRDAVKQFCDPEKHGKPQFWGCYADYDWVAFCQLFGPMIDLPKGFPMYCCDIKQLAGEIDLNAIPQKSEHHALADAQLNKSAYEFIQTFPAQHRKQA